MEPSQGLPIRPPRPQLSATVFGTPSPMPPSVVTLPAAGAVVPPPLASLILMVAMLVLAVQVVGTAPSSGTLQESWTGSDVTCATPVLPARSIGGSHVGVGDVRDVPAQLGGRDTNVGMTPRGDYLSRHRVYSPGLVRSDRRRAFFPESNQLTSNAVDVENNHYASRRQNPSKIEIRKHPHRQYSKVYVNRKNPSEDVLIYKSSFRSNSMICVQTRNKRRMLCMDKLRKPLQAVTGVTPDTSSLFFLGVRALVYFKGVPAPLLSTAFSPSYTSSSAGVYHSANIPGVLQVPTRSDRQTLNWSLSGDDTLVFPRRRLLLSVSTSPHAPLTLEPVHQTDASSGRLKVHSGDEGRVSLEPNASTAVQELRPRTGADELSTDGGLEGQSSFVFDGEEGQSYTPAILSLDSFVKNETTDKYDSQAWFSYVVHDVNTSFHVNDSVAINGSVASGNCTEWTDGRSNLFQVSQLLYLTAFLVPHSFRASSFLLRVCLVAAQLLLGVWAVAQLCSLDVLVWYSVLLLVNATHALRCAYLLWPARIPVHLQDLYDKLFRPLKVERVSFSLLTREGFLRKLSAGELYAEEDFTQAATQLAVLLTGRLSVSCNATHLHYIFPNQFVDSPEWEAARGEEESEGLFQVTVAAEEDSCLLVWPRPHLLHLEAEQKALYIVLTCLVGKDITTKLYSLTEQLQQPSPGVDASNLLLPGDPIPRGGRRFSADAVFTSTRGLVRSSAWRDYNLDRSAQAHQSQHRDSKVSDSGFNTPPSCRPSPRATPTTARQALAGRLHREPKSFGGGKHRADGDVELINMQGLGPNHYTNRQQIVIHDGDNGNTSNHGNRVERDCGIADDAKADLTYVIEAAEKTESEHRRRDSLVRVADLPTTSDEKITQPPQ